MCIRDRHYGVCLDEPTVRHFPNGIIAIALDWSLDPDTTEENKDNFWKFKYVAQNSHGFGGALYGENDEEYDITGFVYFEFPELEKEEVNPLLEISIAAPHKEENKDELNYKYLYFENTKYGLVAYFAPSNWLDWENSTILE